MLQHAKKATFGVTILTSAVLGCRLKTTNNDNKNRDKQARAARLLADGLYEEVEDEQYPPMYKLKIQEKEVWEEETHQPLLREKEVQIMLPVSDDWTRYLSDSEKAQVRSREMYYGALARGDRA